MSETSEQRTAAQIETELAATRAELADTVDQLTDRLNPATRAKEAAADPKTRRIALIAVAALATVVAIGRRRR